MVYSYSKAMSTEGGSHGWQDLRIAKLGPRLHAYRAACRYADPLDIDGDRPAVVSPRGVGCEQKSLPHQHADHCERSAGKAGKGSRESLLARSRPSSEQD